MKTLVFADAHIKVGDANRQVLNDFVAFLRSIDPGEFERIVVVGDLFDFWFEYRYAAYAGYFEVLRALADLRDAGVECHLDCGNHDFWAGSFFERDLGVRVHRDSFDVRLGDRLVRFVHGDGVNPNDGVYKVYKRIARTRFASMVIRLVHPDWIMAIAQQISRVSRRVNPPDRAPHGPEIAAVREFARGVIASGEADVVVCGHTHHAAYEAFDSPRGRGLYLNTGGWMDDRAYWVWDGEEFTRYAGLLTERRRAPVSGPEERQMVAPSAVNVAREEPDQA